MWHLFVRRVATAALLVLALTLFAGSPTVADVDPAAVAKVDACASDAGKLGLSRVVEIDTAGGASIGGGKAKSTSFLNDGEVVLTFDDGPIKAYTNRILQTLADQCTKATFFMVGQMAVADPEMVREVAKAGHTIGSHTWSHKNLRPTTLVRAKQEIETAISAVALANGAPIAPFFRFPYLSSNRQAEDYLKSRNIAAIWIDIDSRDYRTRDPKAVETRIMSQLEKERKGIILMHDIHASTMKMLPDLLEDLRVKGFKVVHMVPKTKVDTLAAFDAIAQKALTAKQIARAANPLAGRSLVWTMTPPTTRGSRRPHPHSLDAAVVGKKASAARGDQSSDDEGGGSSTAATKPGAPVTKLKSSVWDSLFPK